MRKMEYSCGAVLYSWNDHEPLYVLVYDSHFGFPKGHIEEKETKEEAALREIREEAGIQAQLDTSFCETVEYELPSKPGVRKQVTFFLASYDPSAVQPQAGNEIKKIRLVRYQDAMTLLWHPNLQQVLEKAHAYLLQAKQV